MSLLSLYLVEQSFLQNQKYNFHRWQIFEKKLAFSLSSFLLYPNSSLQFFKLSSPASMKVYHVICIADNISSLLFLNLH